MFGGRTKNGVTDEFWVYNVEAQTWKPISTNAAPAPRAGHTTAVSADGKLYLFGGDDGESVFK
jgi:N-acetylneuraminic acid mutarotase